MSRPVSRFCVPYMGARDPVPIDEIVKLVHEKKEALHIAKADLKGMVALNKVLYM